MSYPHDLVGNQVQHYFDKGTFPSFTATIPVRHDEDGFVDEGAREVTASVWKPDESGIIGWIKHYTWSGLPNWKFKFLPYIAGEVTTTPYHGAILTGPMTGCYLFRYEQAISDTGKSLVMLAHVGTHSEHDNTYTVKVKKLWLPFAAKEGVRNVTGVNPFLMYSEDEVVEALTKHKLRDPNSAIVAAYFDGDSTPYALLLVQLPAAQGTPHAQRYLVVETIKEMTMEPWDSIRTKATFAH